MGGAVILGVMPHFARNTACLEEHNTEMSLIPDLTLKKRSVLGRNLQQQQWSLPEQDAVCQPWYPGPEGIMTF